MANDIDLGIVAQGPQGKSAYDIAVDNGFKGSEQEWLNTLKMGKGSKGDSAYQVAVNNGFKGTEQDWLNSLKGAAGQNGSTGKSAYQVAVENGFSGTERQWLTSLKGITGNNGAPGSDGKSAYQLAVDSGYKGTEQQWLASLKGDKGDKGDIGPAGADYMAWKIVNDVTDLNTLRTDGRYWLKGNMTNAPHDGWGYLFVDSANPIRILQRWVGDMGSDLYLRTWNDNSWTPWKKVTYGADINVISRANYDALADKSGLYIIQG